MDSFIVNNKKYEVIEFLGKGKSGYSYKVKDASNNILCLKKIHHEPCDYYQFSDKLLVEIDDYNKLIDLIKMPKLIDVDYENEIIIKEYIDGKEVNKLIENKELERKYLFQIKRIADLCKANNLNIDYYPTNFIIKDNILYYVDYECNNYMKEWDYDNWGRKYWENIDDC